MVAGVIDKLAGSNVMEEVSVFIPQTSAPKKYM